MARFNWLGFTNADKRETANMAIDMLDKIQDEPKEIQSAGLIVLFKIMVDLYDLNVSEVIGIAGNIMSNIDGKRPEFKAVEEFMRNEWY